MLAPAFTESRSVQKQTALEGVLLPAISHDCLVIQLLPAGEDVAAQLNVHLENSDVPEAGCWSLGEDRLF